MKIYILRYHHPEENVTRFALIEIGKFTFFEIILNYKKNGFSLEIEA